MKKERFAIFASGGGSNAEAIMKACHIGKLRDRCEVVVVITNNSDAGVLKKALYYGVKTYHISEKTQSEGRDVAILKKLQELRVDLVVLAGYMKPVGSELLNAFPNRILNIHPSLLPKHGGKGMYGLSVHESVIASGDKETGVTVHLVNDQYDQGRVLERVRVEVNPNHNVKELQKVVLKHEHELYPRVLFQIARGVIDLDKE